MISAEAGNLLRGPGLKISAMIAATAAAATAGAVQVQRLVIGGAATAGYALAQ